MSFKRKPTSRLLVAAAVGVLQTPWALAQDPSPQALADARSACAADIQTLCANVPSGGGRILACLKQHKDAVSAGCKQAILKVLQPGAGTATPTTPSPIVPPAPSTDSSTSSAATPPAVAPKAKTHSTTAAVHSGTADRYFLMKQVQIVDMTQAKPQPAYSLMIPTAWKFTGAVQVGIAPGGCFADWYSVLGEAKSADDSIDFQFLPQYTFQYVADPAAQRQLQQENDSGARFGLKPCPLRAPVHAADFLRIDMIDKYRKGKTIVSIEPFPELNQFARQRLGMPPDPSAADAGGIHTEAARARLAYDDDKGQAVEEWVSAVIVVHTYPSGSGAAYDWHAVMILFMRTPKGQLDANDRLFKLMASTLHPEPKWQSSSNAVIAGLYQKKQQEEAKRSAAIAQFQMKVAQTINGVVANQQRGANNAAFGESQVIRGVQTFRDPTTGATFELSNQYDHAWRNGTNEYVMSDDPSFNPNGNLNGSWNALEVVHPAP